MPARRGNTIAGQIPEGMLTTKQLAARVRVSADTVKRWRDLGVLPATEEKPLGTKGKIYLYDAEALAIARKLVRRTGPLDKRL